LDPILLLATLAKIGFVIFMLLNLGGIMTWVERKQSAVMQDRVGANRAGITIFGKKIVLWGLLHGLADGAKMILKEDFVPAGANRFLHTLAPYLAVIPALLVFAVIPFGPPIEVAGRTIPLQIAELDVGILFVFAIAGAGIYSSIIGGWASNNKYALLGALRASNQMIAYEVSLGFSLIGLMLVFSTASLSSMVAQQGELLWGFLPKWGLFLQPVGFILYMTAALAETKRVPFDVPEGESEIIGYNVEYSGMKFGVFLLAEFIETLILAALGAVMFFGGWQVPYLQDFGFVFPGGTTIELASWLVFLLRVGGFFLKLVIGVWIFMLIRWTLPRFRYDQLMRLGWKYLLPLSIVNTFVTALIVLLVD
jgi:NADH-quinone oxidoreductase subunit H